jgi:hypothetical protein
MTDTIEAFLYDSVLEVDAVCRTMEARSYNAASVAKDGSETERRVFLAARGELLKIAILQVSMFVACVSISPIRAEVVCRFDRSSQMDRIGLKNGIFPHAYPFLQSSQLLPQKDSILFDVPASPIIAETAKAEESASGSTRQLLEAVNDRERFYSSYLAHVDDAKSVERGSGRVRVRFSLDERIAEIA